MPRIKRCGQCNVNESHKWPFADQSSQPTPDCLIANNSPRAVLASVLIGLAVVLGCGDGGSGAAAEKEAATKLKAMNALVINDGAREHVASVNLSRAKDQLDEAMKLLADLKYVGSVDVKGTGVSDEQLAVVSGLTKLASLQIADNPITDAGLQHLRGLDQLEALYLGSTKISGKGLEVIGDIESLKILDLSHADLSGGDLAALGNLPNLEWLLLEDVELTDEQVAALEVSNSLRRLSLSKDKVSAEALERLAQAKSGLKIDD